MKETSGKYSEIELGQKATALMMENRTGGIKHGMTLNSPRMGRHRAKTRCNVSATIL